MSDHGETSSAVWPRGGGKLGALIRGFDWSTTSLGPISDWPQSLRTATDILLLSPVPIVMLWGEDGVMLYNDAYSGFAGGRHPQLLGSKVREGWPEVADFNDNVMRVGLAGGTLAYREQELTLWRTGAPEQVWMNLDYSPVLDESGKPAGVFCILAETTERVRVERALRESEDHYRTAVELNPQIAWTATPDGELDHVAQRWFEWTGVSGLGENRMLVTHPDDRERSLAAWTQAFTTGGVYDIEHRVRVVDGSYRWMRSRAYARGDAEGRIVKWYGTTEDIEDQKRTKAALEESEARFRAITNSIDQMIWSTQPDGYHDFYNQRWYDYVGVPEGSTDGEAWNGMFHPDDQERAWETWRHSLATGEPYHIEYRLRHRSGRYRWVLGRAQPVRDAGGKILRWYGSCTDIDDLKTTQAALQDSVARLASESHTLEVLYRLGAEVAAELDLGALVQRVVDAGVELTGAQFGAFFYNVLDEAGASYMLYSLSGANRSDFAGFGMPRATAVFAPTFRGEGVIRASDITADPRYGHNHPHRGIPEGHPPVRSYLAVPVMSRSGEVIGGLFFGHADPGQFDERSERVMTGLAAQAAIAIDNARLFQAAQQANEMLETRVAERTAELEAAHEQLRQAQKMEAVGQLTGGIAHDFNNLLTGIIGSLDLMQRRIQQGRTADIDRFATTAMTSANRAAALTHRLLAFSRRQPLDPKPVNANRLVSGMEELLRRTIGEAVALEIVTAGGLWLTLCDPHQLENALLNLAINARDAMPGGGKLVIETCNAHLDDAYAALQREVSKGQYVCICVTDTGVGMPPDVVAKAFDPFFTTKPMGQGTGLGLSMIYGFARQSEGYARIYSEVGEGTTVKLYLPRHYGAADEPEPERADTESEKAQGEVVLVVEDEHAVRDLVVEVLRDLGYQALEAVDGPSGLRMLQSDMHIDLLVTDIGLPGLNGRQLADAARQHRPELKVMFMTGYAENATIANGFLDPGMEMITKPFAVETLTARIREIIERG